jgi:meiotic recombination protein SPO11
MSRSLARRRSLAAESPDPSVGNRRFPLSSASSSRSTKFVQVPSNDLQDGALAQIEGILESMVDAVKDGVELSIPYRNIRSAQNGAALDSSQGEGSQNDEVRFPGRTIQEAKKFGMCRKECYPVLRIHLLTHTLNCVSEALFRIIELSHEALLCGNLITKRFEALPQLLPLLGQTWPLALEVV